MAKTATLARKSDKDAPESAADWLAISAVLRADPETGHLYWRENRRRVRAGDQAGFSLLNGYWGVKVNQKQYPLHRVMWLLVHGAWPKDEIDHINRNPSDNRIANLRQATRADNACNRRRSKNNTSGVAGVTWDKKQGRWLARAWRGRQHLYAGHYDKFADAVAARQRAVVIMHGDFASTG